MHLEHERPWRRSHPESVQEQLSFSPLKLKRSVGKVRAIAVELFRGALTEERGGRSACARSRQEPNVGANHCTKGGILNADRKQKKVVKSLPWADEVGGEIKRVRIFQRVSKASFGQCFKEFEGREVNPKLEVGKKDLLAIKAYLNHEKVVGGDHSSPGLGSFKEVLLKQHPKQASYPVPASRKGLPSGWGKGAAKRGCKGRCFKFLASNHRVADCRDLVRCLMCWRIGHRASRCPRNDQKSGGKMNPNSAQRQHGRVRSLKVFVPYTEEYMRRTDLKRNATLVDVVQPANLGLAPQ